MAAGSSPASIPARAARFEWLAGRPATALLLGVWGAAEAFLFPIVPDVGLCLLALVAPRRTPVLFAAVVVGAAVGTVVLAGAAAADPVGVSAVVGRLPGIDASQVEEARRSIGADGLLGFAQLGPGAPLKLHTLAWLDAGGDAPGAVAGSIVNRVVRIGPIVAAGAAGGLLFGPWIRRHVGLTAVAYVLGWVAVYALLWA